MSDVGPFGLIVALVGLAIAVAVLSNRLSERVRVPAPAFFLIGAALASDLVPALSHTPVLTVQRVVTVALIPILFDGGMHIGWRRFHTAAGAIAWIGVAGTLVTAGAVALLAHLLFGLGWLTAMLLGTALAPTDPAVVFSVLGKREISGRSGLILEGESGANDPVGIALMVSLLGEAGTTGWYAVGHGVLVFLEQIAIGTAVGVVGGFLLLQFMRRVPLPSEGLYPLRTFASALALYGLATVAHGSGFLAVFLAGILVGDAHAPYKTEITRFHSALASLAEIVAFVGLGLTIQLHRLNDGAAALVGLVLAVLLALVVRPVLVGLLSLAIRLRTGERAFVLWAGLKGAVPILLGTYLFTARIADASRIYDIIFVVVAFSVIVQGGLVPAAARRLGVPMRILEPEPWSLGLRFRHRPHGIHRYTVAAGSVADGATIADLPLGEQAWVSLVSRDGQLVQVRGDTRLHAGDEVLVLADADGTGTDGGAPAGLFTPPGRLDAPGRRAPEGHTPADS
ncbi:MAG: cation:proton antiporter [Micromonosporaceae bacterium]|nr:cation:proton antiporter [Micromonosporaceae bacterium]